METIVILNDGETFSPLSGCTAVSFDAPNREVEELLDDGSPELLVSQVKSGALKGSIVDLQVAVECFKLITGAIKVPVDIAKYWGASQQPELLLTYMKFLAAGGGDAAVFAKFYQGTL